MLLASLFAGLGLLIGGGYLLHEAQMRRNAQGLLEAARRAELEAARRPEAGNSLFQAEGFLKQYLKIRSGDAATWAWYARVIEKRDVNHRRRKQIYMVLEQALQHDPGDLKVLRRCAELALERGLDRFVDAEHHLKNLLDHVQQKSQDQPALAEMADVEDLLGQCNVGLARYAEAEEWFAQALKHDAHRVACYDRLARLRRTSLRKLNEADRTIGEMVAKNPKSGEAYLFRWRYARDFAPPAAAADLTKAVELAPEDPEVLLTAAIASDGNRDATATRKYLEKGFKLHPENAPLALALARLELREKHLERGEEILRQSFQANHHVALALHLAETLILEDKIEGRDQANSYINLLRSHGLGDTYVPYLDAAILFQQKKWAQAVTKIETARVLLATEPGLAAQLDVMLAECHRHLGNEQERIQALRQAVERDKNADGAPIELTQALVRSGKLDQAISVLQPLAARRPEWRLDLARLLLQKAIRQPRDERNWREVELALREAEKALPQSGEPLILARFDALTAQDHLEEARSLLSSALAKEPRNLNYRLALAGLSQRQGQGPAALQILDQAEKELGPSPGIELARLDCWSLNGGDAAKVAVAKLAETREKLSTTDREVFLDRLAAAELRLGEIALARQHWRELAALQPDNVAVRMALVDLALTVGDHRDATALVEDIRKAEGDNGTAWRFAMAASLIDRVRRGELENLDEARRLADEITQRHPKSPGGFALNGALAELGGSPDQAIGHYLSAVELGSVQPSMVRQLVRLLNERGRFDDINHVSRVLRGQGAALDEITIEKALDAIRRQDFDRGITLARQVFPERSTSFSDHLTMGRLYMAAGRKDEAGKEFRRAVDLGPGVPQSWLTYVVFLVQTKQLDQARGVVEAARRALPPERATITLAQCWSALGDDQRAEDLVDKALSAEGKSNDPDALRTAVTLYRRRSRLDKAERCLDMLDRQANLAASDRSWSNRTRANMLLAKGRRSDRERALRLVDENLARDRNNNEDQVLKVGVLALLPGRRGEAIAILEKLATAGGLSASNRFLLAQLHLIQGDEKKYQDEMQKLLVGKAPDPRYLTHFIDFCIRRHELDQADRWLADLKKADPKGLAALEREARLLDLRKRRPELLALLDAHGRAVPDQVGSVAGLLDLYGFAREAEAAHRAFVARDPGQPLRALTLAEFLARHDRVSEAMEILKTAWSTCPKDRVAGAALTLFDAPSAGEAERRQIQAWVAEAVRNQPAAVALQAKLASIWLMEGRIDAAAACYRRVLAGSPDNGEALNNLAWLLALQSTGRSQEALKLIDHAIDIAGAVPALVDTRAMVLIRNGQVDEAIRELTRAMTNDPRNPSFAGHLAWAYHSLGRTEEARRALRTADDLGWQAGRRDPLETALIDKLRRELAQ